jgi:hypothetical protein
MLPDIRIVAVLEADGRWTAVVESKSNNWPGHLWHWELERAEIEKLRERKASASASPEADDPTAPAPFRSGAAGRPSAMDLVEVEAKRRIEKGEVIPTRNGLTKFATALSAWWEIERKKFKPPGPTAGMQAIRNRLRSFWRSRLPVA